MIKVFILADTMLFLIEKTPWVICRAPNVTSRLDFKSGAKHSVFFSSIFSSTLVFKLISDFSLIYVESLLKVVG